MNNNSMLYRVSDDLRRRVEAHWLRVQQCGAEHVGVPAFEPGRGVRDQRKRLKQNPFGGHLFAFRGKRADRIKVLWWDGTGLCLYAKRLERGRFVWPLTQEGATVLTPAQLSMLCEGIDWRVPVRTDALSHGSREAPRCAG